jgi:hypothetical protein
VYILAGQSNMAGRGDGAEVPADILSSVEGVSYHYVCSFGADRGPPFSEGGAYHSDGWDTTRPCRKHPSTPGPHFGPELSFAATLGREVPEHPIAIIKHGRGGSILATDWVGELPDQRRFGDAMMAQVREALRDLENSGDRYVVKGFVWMQGEGDTTRREYAESYHENFSIVLARLRRELEDPQLPVVIGRIGDGSKNPKMVHTETVRRAQEAIAEEDPHIAWVDTDDLPLGDFVHYSSAGQLTLGERFATAMAGLQNTQR